MQTIAAEPIRLPRKVRVAMVGFVGHTGEILSQLPRLPDVELVAVSDPDPAVIARAARDKHVAATRKYARLAEMLDKEKPDVVAVCNDNGARASAVLECVKRKIHVISEKPLAINAEDFLKVQQAVTAQKVSLGLLVPMRFEPPFAALRKIVQDGQIGEVIQVSAQKSYKASTDKWRHERATYGSTILWIGIHMIDLMRWASGREFIDATGWQSRVQFPELGDQENVSASVFQLDNGGLAILRMDYLRPNSAPTHGDDRIRLAGTKGVAEYMAATGVTLIGGNDKPRTLTDLPAQGSVFVSYLQATFSGAKPEVALPDIWRINEITLAAHQSSLNGAKTVRIPAPIFPA